jgi:hypothetical protein
METLYESPSVSIMEILAEGVLCSSYTENMKEVEGEW